MTRLLISIAHLLISIDINSQDIKLNITIIKYHKLLQILIDTKIVSINKFEIFVIL